MDNALYNDKRLAGLFSSGELLFEENAPLKNMTGFRTGGTADIVFKPKTPEACRVLMEVFKNGIVILGNGSNVVACDGRVKTPVLCTSSLVGLEKHGETITAYAGTPLSKLAAFARDNSLSGAEFLFGIPGSVGGACAMNAGAYGHELVEIAISFTVCDSTGRIYTVTKEEAGLSYRHSRFTDRGELVVSAVFGLKSADKKEISGNMDALMAKRRDKQPLEYPSCGSYFKRPEGYFAGKLIEDCLLKGASVGGAQVSEKHAGFIVNIGQATTKDIIELENLVRKRVFDKFGVTLECEVKKLGEQGFEK